MSILEAICVYSHLYVPWFWKHLISLSSFYVREIAGTLPALIGPRTENMSQAGFDFGREG